MKAKTKGFFKTSPKPTAKNRYLEGLAREAYARLAQADIEYFRKAPDLKTKDGQA